MAPENAGWSYQRITGELLNLGHRVSPSTVRNTHIKAGIEHAPRRVHLLGITHHPTAAWTIQQARNLLMDLQMPLRFLIRDRDSKHTTTFDALFEADDVTIIKTPPQAPRANAICERSTSTLRRECTDRTLIYNERHLLHVLNQYLAHYNQHRPHRALHRRPPLPPPSVKTTGTHIHRRKIVNGLINEYTVAA
jgi:transposase InsO family protein